jgi:hypothetical protein
MSLQFQRLWLDATALLGWLLQAGRGKPADCQNLLQIAEAASRQASIGTDSLPGLS